MPKIRTITPEEVKRWAYEFMLTDFWNLVLKPRLESERQHVADIKRIAALKGEVNTPFGWEFYLMALDDFEHTWLPEWQGPITPEKEPDIEPPAYVSPRYPKTKGDDD